MLYHVKFFVCTEILWGLLANWAFVVCYLSVVEGHSACVVCHSSVIYGLIEDQNVSCITFVVGLYHSYIFQRVYCDFSICGISVSSPLSWFCTESSETAPVYFFAMCF